MKYIIGIIGPDWARERKKKQQVSSQSSPSKHWISKKKHEPGVVVFLGGGGEWIGFQGYKLYATTLVVIAK